MAIARTVERAGAPLKDLYPIRRIVDEMVGQANPTSR